MAKVEDLRTFDGDTLHRLRDRAQHVIVVGCSRTVRSTSY